MSLFSRKRARNSQTSLGSNRRTNTSRPRTRTAECLEKRAMLSANLGILVLDPTGIGTLTRTGNNTIAVTNGDIVIDSSSTSAGKFSGNGSVSANNIDVTGKLSNSGGKVVGTVVTGSPALADPLAASPSRRPRRRSSRTLRSTARRSLSRRALTSTASRSAATPTSPCSRVFIICKEADSTCRGTAKSPAPA